MEKFLFCEVIALEIISSVLTGFFRKKPAELNYEIHSMDQSIQLRYLSHLDEISLVISERGESQKGFFKKTNRAKFS